jgi:hypothetical protein
VADEEVVVKMMVGSGYSAPRKAYLASIDHLSTYSGFSRLKWADGTFASVMGPEHVDLKDSRSITCAGRIERGIEGGEKSRRWVQFLAWGTLSASPNGHGHSDALLREIATNTQLNTRSQSFKAIELVFSILSRYASSHASMISIPDPEKWLRSLR